MKNTLTFLEESKNLISAALLLDKQDTESNQKAAYWIVRMSKFTDLLVWAYPESSKVLTRLYDLPEKDRLYLFWFLQNQIDCIYRNSVSAHHLTSLIRQKELELQNEQSQ